jgi:hypothetical protein
VPKQPRAIALNKIYLLLLLLLPTSTKVVFGPLLSNFLACTPATLAIVGEEERSSCRKLHTNLCHRE